MRGEVTGVKSSVKSPEASMAMVHWRGVRAGRE